MIDRPGRGQTEVARYEGMDDLLQRLRMRIEPQVATPAPRAVAPVTKDAPRGSMQYRRLGGSIEQLLRRAEQIHDLLTTESFHALSVAEQDELLAMLGKVSQELTGCEAALRQRAPRE